jgi:beta-1,4-mannosyltransferase
MKILVFPKDDNPYQALLYSNKDQFAEVEYLTVTAKGKVKTITYMPRLLFSLCVWRYRGFKILHIHWLYTFTLPSKIPLSKRLAYINTSIFLHTAKLLGYKIVWTVHNVIPHHVITNNDLKLRQKLSLMSDAKIVHSKSVIKSLKRLKIDVANCHIIDIGSYKSMYPDTISRIQARKQLGIQADEFVCIFMGRIEPYKNIPAIIQAFRELSYTAPNSRLIMAGKASDQKIKNKYIDTAKKEFGSRLIIPGFVLDQDVQVYMRAADVALYPFRKVTTTSSVILALSFGVPVIAPRLGILQDLPDRIGYFYDGGGLLQNLHDAYADRRILKSKARAASHYTQTLSWVKIAEQTSKVYSSVVFD